MESAIQVNSIEYERVLSDIIKKNNELKKSFDDIHKEVEKQNHSFDKLTKNMESYLKNIKQISANVNGNKATNQSPSTSITNLFNTIQSKTNNQQQLLGVTSSSINSRQGQNSLLNTLNATLKGIQTGKGISSKGITAVLDNKSISSLTSAINSKGVTSAVGSASATSGASAGLGAVSSIAIPVAIITALVAILTKLTKVGGEAYKQQLNVARATKTLGDGSRYAIQYAKELNQEYGINMSKTITQLGELSKQFTSKGFSTEDAGKYAVYVGKLAEIYRDKMGKTYQESFDLMTAAMNGSESALIEMTGYGQNAFAGWLYEMKGINMYAVQLSETARQGYMAEYIGYVTTEMQGLSSGVKTTAQRMEEINNKLEDISVKLKAIFIPLFETVVSVISSVVDFIFNAVNKVREFLGMNPLEVNIETNGNLFNKGTEKQLQNWTKLGEKIDATKGKLYSFDEVESQTGLMDNQDFNIDSALSNLDESLSNIDDFTVKGSVDLDTRSIEDFRKEIDGLPPLEQVLKVRNKEELQEVISNLSTAQKLGKTGFAIAMEALKVGDGWTFLEGLVWGFGGILPGIIQITDGIKRNIVEGGFDLAIRAAEKLEQRFPALEGLSSLLTTIKEKVLNIFDKWHEFKIRFLTSGVEIITGAIESLKKGFNDLTQIISNPNLNFGQKLEYIGGSTAAGLYNFGSNALNSVKNIFTGGNSTPNTMVFDPTTGNMTLTTSKGQTQTITSFNKFTGDYSQSLLPSYDSGGIALSPHIAQIGTSKGEVAIPLGSVAAEPYYETMADKIRDKLSSPATSDSYTINIGQNSTIIGNRAELNKLADYIIDRMTVLEKQRGNLRYGTI